MQSRGYNRPPKRKQIPHLFSNILQVVAEADRPLTQPEIVEALVERLDRSDEELKRQITVSLHDALINGYLRVKNYRYSSVSDRLGSDLDSGVPRISGTGNRTPRTEDDHWVHQRLLRSVSNRLSTSDPDHPTRSSTSGNSGSDDQRVLERLSRAAIVSQSGPEHLGERVVTVTGSSSQRLRSSQSRRPSELE
ncbi:uncharacterized protein [Drosophila pseudoobscura]|uniref:Uncharacterized protein n=1 Tax=Drosophila pseudoobscura pseudoobscura TaxID=46245 RepID=A0A0R3P6T3_DROPS|nr:uncharacterized protein LOC26532027 [Drosophila pseudoobscura]